MVARGPTRGLWGLPSLGKVGWKQPAGSPAGSCHEWAQGGHIVGQPCTEAQMPADRKDHQDEATATLYSRHWRPLLRAPGQAASQGHAGEATTLNPQPGWDRLRLTLGKE